MRSFFAEIDRYADAVATQRASLEAAIWARYGRDRAMLALDMSDFSLSVRRDGVLSYLCRIRRMHAITAPLVARHGGEVVKYEADNLLAAFEQPRSALAAAIVIHQQMHADPQAQPVSIGLSYGRVLLIDGCDAHGDAVNTAFKLGEDVARRSEILACGHFIDAIGADHGHRIEARPSTIAGLQLDAWRIHLQQTADEG